MRGIGATAVLMLLMSAAGACGEAGSGNEPPPVAAVAGEADLESAAEAVSDDDSLAALQGVRWQWMAPDDGEAPPGDVSITAEFEPGRITGHAGCNGYFATVTAPAEGQIAVGPAGSTRRACEPSVMDVESRFLQALSQVQRWQRQDGELVLSGSGDSLRFIATPVGDQP